ncbi:unnamed protein product [Menidia menidia]|uniref:(Atlantic silverside) hypothetical protein n=1 Tax=Menidia menidia TaxID=238744 RepID=A0A8S4AQA6_9TELE|nr:unnamed protein product [Menidia menidia]
MQKLFISLEGERSSAEKPCCSSSEFALPVRHVSGGDRAGGGGALLFHRKVSALEPSLDHENMALWGGGVVQGLWETPRIATFHYASQDSQKLGLFPWCGAARLHLQAVDVGNGEDSGSYEPRQAHNGAHTQHHSHNQQIQECGQKEGGEEEDNGPKENIWDIGPMLGPHMVVLIFFQLTSWRGSAIGMRRWKNSYLIEELIYPREQISSVFGLSLVGHRPQEEIPPPLGFLEDRSQCDGFVKGSERDGEMMKGYFEGWLETEGADPGLWRERREEDRPSPNTGDNGKKGQEKEEIEGGGTAISEGELVQLGEEVMWDVLESSHLMVGEFSVLEPPGDILRLLHTMEYTPESVESTDFREWDVSIQVELVLRECRGTGARGPGQACGHFALVRTSGSPTGSHGGKGRVGVVAEGMGRLQGQRLDAVGQQATGGIVILVREVELVGAWLLDRWDKPALGRGGRAGVLALRGQEAVGLGNGPFAGVEPVLRQCSPALFGDDHLGLVSVELQPQGPVAQIDLRPGSGGGPRQRHGADARARPGIGGVQTARALAKLVPSAAELAPAAAHGRGGEARGRQDGSGKREQGLAMSELVWEDEMKYLSEPSSSMLYRRPLVSSSSPSTGEPFLPSALLKVSPSASPSIPFPTPLRYFLGALPDSDSVRSTSWYSSCDDGLGLLLVLSDEDRL